MTASTRALADLARAGYRVLHEPSTQVEFEIHHLADRPGALVDIAARGSDRSGFAETLSSGAHGVGLVIGTRIGDSPAHPGSREHQHGAWVELEHDAGDRFGFRGSERPNLTFQHESAQTFEGVISIEDEPKRMLLRHGLAVLDTLQHIAETALQAGEAPLLTLQCPAQLPPTNSFRESGGINGRVIEPARSSSMAIRFAIALQRPSADIRLQIADRLARHCEDRGLGLWLADTRPGYRTGNWFLVLPHDRSKARGRYRHEADHRRASNAAEGCLPLTLVGPAREGSMHAILSFLGQFPAIGLLGCSMTVLDELAFLHLQLSVNGASGARLSAVNSGIADLLASGAGPADVLPQVVQQLLGDHRVELPGEEHTGRLIDRAGDYQTVVGPALPVVAGNVRRVPIWIGWQMRKSDAGLRTPLLALHRAVDRLGLTAADETGARSGPPNIEYLICRQLGATVLRGKGKLAVARTQVERRFKDNRRGAAQLAADLEDAWKAQLRADGDEDQFSDVSVSSREFLLGGGYPSL
ncbi:MAG: hypothetical protein QOG76_5080 [Pseudonocardiales bacterium]|nr:hypothetical protein [Pseudonocardiales bacterium]